MGEDCPEPVSVTSYEWLQAEREASHAAALPRLASVDAVQGDGRTRRDIDCNPCASPRARLRDIRAAPRARRGVGRFDRWASLQARPDRPDLGLSQQLLRVVRLRHFPGPERHDAASVDPRNPCHLGLARYHPDGLLRAGPEASGTRPRPWRE